MRMHAVTSDIKNAHAVSNNTVKPPTIAPPAKLPKPTTTADAKASIILYNIQLLDKFGLNVLLNLLVRKLFKYN